jgi:Tol biopolymer transport system component
MKTRNTVFVIILALGILALSACGAAPTATPTPKPTAPATPTVPPTATLPPTPTPVPPTPVPPTPTSIPPQATTTQTVNVRQGPGTNFAIAGKMPQNTSAVILGKNEDGKWLQVAFPDAAHPGWIAAAFATVTGSVDTLPVVAVAPPATATPGGPSPTKVAAAATPTQTFPAPKGTISFVTFDPNQNSYVLNNLDVASHNFSEDRLLGPKPGPVDLRNGTNAAPFAWSPNGSRLAFVYSSNSLVDVLRVTDSAGNAQNVVSHGGQSAPGGISSPTWSPDGSTVAYIGIDNDYRTQFLYTIPAGGGTEQRLFPTSPADQQTRIGEVFRGLAWSKNYFLFVSSLTGHSEIWRLNSDGSGPLQLTNDKRENGSPAWSPDGKQFAYYSKQADNSYQIMVANADGTGAHKLTNTGNNWTPTWSPDGNWIAFASTRGGRLDVYIMDKNGGNVKLLTDKVTTESFLPGSWR